MSTVGFDGSGQQAPPVRGLWPASRSSIEPKFRFSEPVEDQWGRSESIDPDNVGDIADEGMGHRG